MSAIRARTCCREGILFSMTPLENPADPALPPPNLAFLEILHEFTSKLMRQDKRVVVAFLDRHMPANIVAGAEDMYMPLFTYRWVLLRRFSVNTIWESIDLGICRCHTQIMGTFIYQVYLHSNTQTFDAKLRRKPY